MESDIRDNPSISRFEMSLGDGALAVVYYKVEDAGSSCSTRTCRKSCPAKDMDRDGRMTAFAVRTAAKRFSVALSTAVRSGSRS